MSVTAVSGMSSPALLPPPVAGVAPAAGVASSPASPSAPPAASPSASPSASPAGVGTFTKLVVTGSNDAFQPPLTRLAPAVASYSSSLAPAAASEGPTVTSSALTHHTTAGPTATAAPRPASGISPAAVPAPHPALPDALYL